MTLPLPDGSLLTYRPAGAFGGDPGVYVVAPDGSTRKVLPSGTALGVITAYRNRALVTMRQMVAWADPQG